MGKWKRFTFDDVLSDETRFGHKIQKEDYLETGLYPIIDQGQEYIAGYANDDNGLYSAVPAIVFGDHTRAIKYVDFPFYLGADGVKLLKSKIDDIDYKFLFYYLKTVHIPNTGYNRHFKWLKEIAIPVPPLRVQQKIADVLDRVSTLVEKRKVQIRKCDLLVKSQFIDFLDIIIRVEITKLSTINKRNTGVAA